jgi:hypothetical protein
MKDRLYRDGSLQWLSIALEGARMIEPMLPDLAEAARRPSAAEQLAARVAGHAHCPVLLRTPHRWRKLDEPRDV